MKINVNGVDRDVVFAGPESLASYEDILRLVGPGTVDLSTVPLLTMTYAKADQPYKPDGMLAPGESVKVKEGTVFNVADTSRA